MEQGKYTGYQILHLSDQELSDFYGGTPLKVDLYNNEYLLLEDERNQIVDKYCYQNGKLRTLKNQVLQSNYSGKIIPKNIQQELAIDLLKGDSTTVKLLTGMQGSGKTFFLVNAALEAIEKHKFEKIVWVRNNVQVKDTDNIGSLPGTELDKLLPYVMPFADHCGGIEGVQRLIDQRILEVIPLGFIRGRSIRNAVIISSEAENLSKNHIQLLLGRVDVGTQLWLDADARQRDREVFVKSAGLETTIDRLKGNPLFGYVHLQKSERSATAQLADLLND